ITCSTGYKLSGSTCVAITCSTGYKLVGNSCQAITCSTGYKLVGNSCQAITCSTGYKLVGNSCVAMCAGGQNYNSSYGRCVPNNCAYGRTSNGNCNSKPQLCYSGAKLFPFLGTYACGSYNRKLNRWGVGYLISVDTMINRLSGAPYYMSRSESLRFISSEALKISDMPGTF
ncbi:MAG: hypothetical protein GY793_11025, partial [Proteobacteria bacterium]|nr:hypothetical protein [Pseudomonadota bacterium]